MSATSSGLLHVAGAGNSVHLHRCTLERASAEGCAGLLVSQQAQAVLVDSTVRHIHRGSGCTAELAGSRLVALGTSVADVARSGVEVAFGARCELEGVSVTSCEMGVTMMSPGSKLLAKRSTLDGNRAANLIADAGVERRYMPHIETL